MLRPERFPVPLAPWPMQAPGVAPAPAPGRGAAGAPCFAAMFDEVRTEVGEFIEQGSGTALVPGLEAFARPSRLQADSWVGAAFAANDAQRTFLSRIEPWAKEAGQRLGVAPEILAAQAALESGWGQRPLRAEDGRDSHNLFAIKATSGWRGEVVRVVTTEYEDGLPVRKTEPFRSYPDYASAFRDFTRLLSHSARYQAALGAGADARVYAEALARGGYATDPAYADKLARLAERFQGMD